MYAFPEMIDMGLKEGETWTSSDHRIVAINVCIGNSHVHDMDTLKHNVFIINQIFMNRIREVNYFDLANLGVIF